MDRTEEVASQMMFEQMIKFHEHQLKLQGVVFTMIEVYQSQYNITRRQARCLMSDIARDELAKIGGDKPRPSDLNRTIGILITEGNKRFVEGRIPEDCKLKEDEEGDQNGKQQDGIIQGL